MRWFSPGLLWAVSSIGSGSVLFTPRVGSRYGYELFWILLLVCFLMWAMIREAARYTVITGRTLLDGFTDLPGPRNWALWVIFLPQLVASVVGVGGLAALVGSALQAELPGNLQLWAWTLLGGSTLLVSLGGYKSVARVARALAFALAGAALAAATAVSPSPSRLAAGLVPGLPSQLDVPFVLPWIGTILAGSMGILWYSYWAATRGYGGGAAELHRGEHEVEPSSESLSREQLQDRLDRWMRTMSNTALVGVAFGTLAISSFLVLGAELLGPEGLVPSGVDVAVELTRLFSSIWGQIGYWLMMTAIVIALGGSVLANQDGWGRSFADITLLLHRRAAEPDREAESRRPRWLRVLTGWRPESVGVRKALKVFYVVVVTGAFPALVIGLVSDPVAIMSISGTVATVHTPFLVVLILLTNRRLPKPFRPSLPWSASMVVAAGFYGAFAVLYFLDMGGLLSHWAS